MIFRKYLFLFIFLISFLNFCFGQAFIKDTMVVDFGTIVYNPIKIQIDSVVDKRKMPAECINISEKTKYLYIPVDFYTNVRMPVSNEIRNLFANDSNNDSIKFRLEINEFNVSKNKVLFKFRYSYNAAVSVYKIKNNQLPEYSGTLLYENDTIFRKDNPRKNYPVLIDNWKRNFSNDLNNVYLKTKGDTTKAIYNYIQEPMAWEKNMMVDFTYCQGIYGDFLVDGEIMFSGPETKKIFNRQGSIMRYRHENKFESLEFSLSNKQFNYRLNDKYLFTMKTKLFWGLNLWNSNEYRKHGLQDIFILDFSASQSILYNPFYKRGIICGLGIMEDATYIYSEYEKFKPYIMFQLGIKL
jgi:hypothetical protein